MIARNTRRLSIVASLLLAPALLPAQQTVTITLPEAIRLAAARNIDVLRGDNDIRLAETFVESARGAFHPDLNFSAGPTARYRMGSTAENDVDVAVKHFIGELALGFSSDYTLYDGGANRATLDRAEALAAAAGVDVDRTVQVTIYTVVALYVQIATQREMIGVERENLTAERRLLEQVEAFTEIGTRPISDLYTQQANVAAAEVRLLEAEYLIERASLAMVQALRLDPSRRYDFPTPTTADLATIVAEADLPVVQPSVDTTALVMSAIERRPEIIAQRTRIDAAEMAIRLAETGKSPTVSLFGSLGTSYTSLRDRYGFTDQLFAQNPGAALGLSLTIPFFDRNRTEVAIAQARILQREELLRMAELRQDAEIEVRQVLLDLTTATARLSAAERRVIATRAALDVEQTRYESGANTLVELSQARARMIESEAQVIEARNILTLRTQTLAFALGIITPVRVPVEMPGE